MNHKNFIVPANRKIRLRDYDPASTGKFKDEQDAAGLLQQDIARLAKYQNMLYAQNQHAVLIIFQAMDAAGKDSTIKHVMSGINPQGCQVYSFKAPSSEELDHDFLWRAAKALPERGRIGIFNRSYYEETLVVRVHPDILAAQQLPPELSGKNLWKQRFAAINNFEQHLAESGTLVLKFFLNVSKEEQKRRFIARIIDPDKNWKFSLGDVKERAYWDDYMHAFEQVFSHTSSKWAPWHIIPADNKWYTRTVVADIIASRIKGLKLAYPVLSTEHEQDLLLAKDALENEQDS